MSDNLPPGISQDAIDNLSRPLNVSEEVDEIRDMRTPTQWLLSYPDACTLVEKFSEERVANEKAVAFRIAKWCEELEKENTLLLALLQRTQNYYRDESFDHPVNAISEKLYAEIDSKLK